jgi:anti-sigma regulatory factor (Ser/Thr protein kinase)
MGTQLRFEVSEQSHIGACRRAAKQLAERYITDESVVGKISIIATELATNLTRHAGSGELLLQVLDDGALLQMEMLSIDRGPGMSDVDRCLKDGYSTGGTAGNGLGAISRLSTDFDIYSIENSGTIVFSRTTLKKDSAATKPATPAWFDMGAINLAVAGEIECGDTWRVASDDNNIAMLVVDGLGHGSRAADASQAAAKAFSDIPFNAPQQSMQNLHKALAGSRGAAAACAVLNKQNPSVDYAGIGNISSSVTINERSQGMVSHSGILGVQMHTNRQFSYAWPSGSPMIMHSDGLSARWTLSSYPGLSTRHPAIIAAMLYRDFARKRDDVTVLVARYRDR